MYPAYDSLFPRISIDKKNNELSEEAIEMVYLRESVVTYLREIEEGNGNCFWWQNKKLMNVFDDLYTAGVLALPKDPVDRLRWIALLCVDCCNWQEFDCSNLVTPLDFMTGGMFELFREEFSEEHVKTILDFRDKLRKVGWKKAFEE